MLAKYFSCFYTKKTIPERKDVIREIESMNVRVTENNTDSLSSETSAVYSMEREYSRNYKYNPN